MFQLLCLFPTVSPGIAVTSMSVELLKLLKLAGDAVFAGCAWCWFEKQSGPDRWDEGS